MATKKFVSKANFKTGMQSVADNLEKKAPLTSPDLKGTPTAPTATSGTNNTQIATTAFVKDAVDTATSNIKADLGSALAYKGSVPDYDSLPKSDQQKGDTYNVVAAHGNTPAGTNYAWDGEKWDPLGGDIDLSAYATTEAVDSKLKNYPTSTQLEGKLEEYVSDEELEETLGEYVKGTDIDELDETDMQEVIAVLG